METMDLSHLVKLCARGTHLVNAIQIFCDSVTKGMKEMASREKVSHSNLDANGKKMGKEKGKRGRAKGGRSSKSALERNSEMHDIPSLLRRIDEYKTVAEEYMSSLRKVEAYQHHIDLLKKGKEWQAFPSTTTNTNNTTGNNANTASSTSNSSSSSSSSNDNDGKGDGSAFRVEVVVRNLSSSLEEAAFEFQEMERKKQLMRYEWMSAPLQSTVRREMGEPLDGSSTNGISNGKRRNGGGSNRFLVKSSHGGGGGSWGREDSDSDEDGNGNDSEWLSEESGDENGSSGSSGSSGSGSGSGSSDSMDESSSSEDEEEQTTLVVDYSKWKTKRT